MERQCIHPVHISIYAIPSRIIEEIAEPSNQCREFDFVLIVLM
jgi:hypothetical protein